MAEAGGCLPAQQPVLRAAAGEAIPHQNPAFGGLLPPVIYRRLALLGLLLGLEWIPISALVHTGRGGSSFARFALIAISFFIAFGYLRIRSSLAAVSREVQDAKIAWRFLAGHFAAMLTFLGISALSPEFHASFWQLSLSAIWFAAGVLAVALAGLAFVPRVVFLRLVDRTGAVWLYALAAGLATSELAKIPWSPWGDLWREPLNYVTFNAVRFFIGLFRRDLIVERATMTIGNAAFRVNVSPACSGIEGLALILIFTSAWVWFFRKELRFPQALCLIPAGLVAIWLLNAARITALILIGISVNPTLAVNGFHSQAGWISFNCVALSLAVAALRLSWFARVPQPSTPAGLEENPTAVYLLPLLAILAATMITRAASAGVVTAYPLQLMAALMVLWIFRSEYAKLNWRFGPFSCLIGCAAFIIWVSPGLIGGPLVDNRIESGFAAWPTTAAAGWLLLRTTTSVVVAPIAEELAFRAFFIRRLISSDFTSLASRQFTIPSVLISSAAFGVLNGERWLVGTLAGILYSVAFLRRGRIGDAVVAHATTNALLAALVVGGRAGAGIW